MDHNVFISYSSKNKTAADAICHLLESNGIKCWMAPRDIPAGSEYGDLIDTAIKNADVVVVVFSQTAAESQWVKGELNIAFEEQKIIIPYRIDSTPFSGQHRVILNQKHWIDAYPDYQTKFNDLLDAVTLALGKNNNSTRTEKSPSKENKPLYINKFWLLGAIILIIVLVAGCLYIKGRNKPFSYNNNGIKISDITGLSTSQQKMLTEILDNMILIERGEFLMGNDPNFIDYLTSQDSLSVNSHTVYLNPYYISKYEVTQEQWKEFQNLAGCYMELDDKKAIDNVSWEEANAYADTLAALTGLEISLPTEAQWEYAAGGAVPQKEFPFSGFDDGIHHYAWVESDGLTSAAEVGKKLPNKIGLYDMTGNVGEWCLDDFALYNTSNCEDPIVSIGNNRKIIRGGDFKTPNIMNMKTTSRYYGPSFTKRPATGLRLVINKKS